MKRTVCLILAVLMLAMSLTACNDKGFLGTWIAEGGDGTQMRLVFENRKEGYMTAMGGIVKHEFKYSTKNGELELKYSDGEVYTYGYTLSDDKITLTNDEGIELIYTKLVEE